MNAETHLPHLLDADAVRRRYGMADLRAARRVMHKAGAMKVGGRLLVRADDLDRWERDSTRHTRVANTPNSRVQALRHDAIPKPSAPLPADWWRTNAPDGTAGPGNTPPKRTRGTT